MDKFGVSKDLPSSPWADRFPLSHLIFRSGDTNHSMLAPEFPRINDPKYYDRDPLPTDKPPQNGSEIDRVLLTEQRQRSSLFGMSTWRLAALRRYVKFSESSGFISGGHRPAGAIGRASPFLLPSSSPQSPQSSASPWLRPGLQLSLAEMLAAMGLNEEGYSAVYQRERIQVDETKWLSFWRKRNWFDWIDVSQPPVAPAGRTWSVDDPEIWGVLSVVLELANRIMVALIEEMHDGDYWENYVDEFGAAPSPDAAVLLSYAAEQKMSRNRGEASCAWGDSIASHTSAEWTDRLNQLLLTNIFGFAELSRAEGVTQAKPWFNDKDYPYNSLVAVDTKTLEVMLRPDLALEELCTLQVNCAIVIVHELMHAIIICRYQEDGYAGNMLDKARSGEHDTEAEPFLDGKGAAEAGRYMEQLFFGGCSNLLPPNGDTEPKPRPLSMFFTEWPYPGETDQIVPGSDFIQNGHVNKAYHVPSAWCAKMLSESFWQDPNIPRKSENNFHRNNVFLVTYKTRNGRAGHPKRPKVQDLNILPYKYAEDEIAVEAWEERVRIWESHRESWYNKSFDEWSRGPKWNHINCREWLHQFADAFEKKHLFACYKIALNVTALVDDESGRAFIDGMPSPANGKSSWLWTWYVVGLLMMASMPIIHTNMYELPASKIQYHIQLAPSKEAAATHEHIIHANAVVPRNPEWEHVTCRLFYTYFRNMDVKELENHTQLDYLQLIDDVVDYVITTGAIIPISFLNAIVSAVTALRTDREKIGEDYKAGHAARWASDWFFKMPEYDPAWCVYENGEFKDYNWDANNT